MRKGTLGHGSSVGHWTDPTGLTGCTVILPPPGNVTSCDIRGSSPSSRELAHLDTDRKMKEIHGVLLTGGSAFGLAAADGVMTWLSERGIGYDTRIARVPIVPAAVIFDLGAGDPNARPTAAHGRAACEIASEGPVATGRVGAGTGATVGKWAGFEFGAEGGLGIGHATWGDQAISALAVVNSVGDVLRDGQVVAGSSAPEPRHPFPPPPEPEGVTNTVLVVLVAPGVRDKRDARWLAQRGSDGVTIAVRPAHTRYDGDVVFSIGCPSDVTPELDVLGYLAPQAVAAAIVDAVGG